MKETQWVPATVVLVAVGLLIGGASLLRTLADEQPEPAAVAPKFTSPSRTVIRPLPPPPLIDAELELTVAPPRVLVLPGPVGAEAPGAEPAKVLSEP
jgi:hypothetical protein